ncbi:MAG: VOC family protein [Actinobacteria bacterium]|nr:VOC family protein [Actinomycetota bacterium]
MPIRHDAPVGAPTWIDLSTSDVARARAFYGAVFGWTFEAAGPEYGGYVTAFRDGRPVAGMMACQEGPGGWTEYLRTDDVAATVEAATAAGATTYMGATEITDVGWMAMLADPSGALLGLWQPIGHRGFEIVGEAGAPVWHQLTTRDYDAALEFYRGVFGWQLRTEADTDEFRYTTAVFDGEEQLGVMDGRAVLAQGAASAWTVFFGCDDVDKTIALVTENGGTVVRPAEDTPYGRLAAVADPAGAGFNLSSLRT